MNNSPMNVEDLTLYAMGLLDGAESARVEALLATSEEVRQELRETRGDLALLALSAPQQDPPAAARQRLLELIRQESKSAGKAAPEMGNASAENHSVPAGQPLDAPAHSPIPFRPSAPLPSAQRSSIVSRVLPWAGWAIAASLAVVSFNLYRETDGLHERLFEQIASSRQASARAARAQAVLDTLRSTEAQRFLLTKSDTPPVMQARVTYLAQNGSLVFQGSHLDPIPAAKTYELWLIPAAKGGVPIAAGTFKPDERGDASVILPDLPKGVVAGKFGVTMENEGGAATPTAPILMIGQ